MGRRFRLRYIYIWGARFGVFVFVLVLLFVGGIVMRPTLLHYLHRDFYG
jgi:hypothetical protein